MQRFLLIGVCAALGACNDLVSDHPMFEASDRAETAPRDGIWITDDKDCQFDHSRPEAQWPECATWYVMSGSGRDLLFKTAKGQSLHIGLLFVAGTPLILQGELDDATPPPTTSFYYAGVEPQPPESDGRFIRALFWSAACGPVDGTGKLIRPYPGVTEDCRPTSKEAIRAAVIASKRTDWMTDLRWLRAEAP